MMNTSFARVRTWALVACLAGTILTCPAGEEAVAPAGKTRFLPWEKGSIKLGGFVTTFDSSLEFGLEDGAGVSLDGEDVLGLDTSLTVFRVDAMYRPGKSRRHQLDFTYASYHRDGNATLSEDLEIRGRTYPVGARVETVFDFDIIRGTYSYALLQNERLRVALGLGVYAVPLEYGLDIETARGRTAVEGADTTLPLPALALRGEFQLVPKLYLYGGIDAMYLEVSGFKGSLLDVDLGLEYRIWKHFGLGLGFSGLSVAVEGESDNSDYPGVNFVGDVDVRYGGLMLYGKLSF